MKVGIIGCGAIGTVLAQGLAKNRKINRIWLFDRDLNKAEKLARGSRKVEVAQTASSLIASSDLVIEAASQQAVYEYSESVLKAGKNLMIMSVGALLDDRLKNKLERLAEQKKAKIYLPSGAILGIDGVKAAKLERIDQVTLFTTKNPRAFEGNKYLESKCIKLKRIKKPTTLFEGTAKQAVKYFPENINVAACLSLAGIGSKKTRVKIIADPKVKQNIHTIIVKGAAGEFQTETKNIICPTNPKTSYLAALAACATVRKILETIQVGT